MRVNVDHPHPSQAGRVRDFAEQIGELRDVRLRSDGIYADLHYNRFNPNAAAIVEAAQRFPNTIGLSHNATGQKTRHGDREVVEAVDAVRSVDIVTRPATNTGLFEAEDAAASRHSDLTHGCLRELTLILKKRADRFDAALESGDSREITAERVSFINAVRNHTDNRVMSQCVIPKQQSLIERLRDRLMSGVMRITSPRNRGAIHNEVEAFLDGVHHVFGVERTATAPEVEDALESAADYVHRMRHGCTLHESEDRRSERAEWVRRLKCGV